MKNICMPEQFRDCENCKNKTSINYYGEGERNIDLYYCSVCYIVYEWNGNLKKITKEQAYKNRQCTTGNK